MKYQILNKNYEQINHPITGLPVKLFRIIAMKDFAATGMNGSEITIKENEIGGLVTAKFENNEWICSGLSQTDSSWIRHSAKLFDNAVLKDSIIQDDARIFGTCRIQNSTCSGKSRVWNTALISNCHLRDNVDVHDSSTVTNSLLFNASKVEGNSNVSDCELRTGSRIFNSKVSWSKLFDQSEVIGSNVDNCILKGRTVVSNSTLKDEVREETIELRVETNAS